MVKRGVDWFPVFNFDLLLLLLSFLAGFSSLTGGPDQLSGGAHVQADLKPGEVGDDNGSGDSCKTRVLWPLDGLPGEYSGVL